jgi:hypothetical protein
MIAEIFIFIHSNYIIIIKYLKFKNTINNVQTNKIKFLLCLVILIPDTAI